MYAHCLLADLIGTLNGVKVTITSIQKIVQHKKQKRDVYFVQKCNQQKKYSDILKTFMIIIFVGNFTIYFFYGS